MSEHPLPAAFYERVADDAFLATRATMSPWDDRLQHGGPPTALLAHVMTRAHPRDDVRIARIASEFLGPIPVGEMRVCTRVVRPGRRIEMLEGALECNGREVVTARVWRIATQDAGSIPPGATAREAVPRLAEATAVPRWITHSGYGEAIEWRYVHGGGAPGPAAVWARPRVPLVAGEPVAALEAAVVVADSANGISGELPMTEWLFVPPSLSLAFERYPRGDWVLLDARTSLGDDGLGVTTFRLADGDGWLAAGTQALLVEHR